MKSSDIAKKADASLLISQGWASLTLSSAWESGSYVYYRNQAGVRQVKMYGGLLNAPIGSYNAVFTLPESMRPTIGIYGICYSTSGIPLMYYIGGDGAFKIKSLSQALSSITIVAELDF